MKMNRTGNVAKYVVRALACFAIPSLSVTYSQENQFPIGQGVTSALAVASKGNMIAIDAFDFKAGERYIVLFDTKQEKIIRELRDGKGLSVVGMGFSRDTTSLISFAGDPLEKNRVTTLVRFWDLQSGEVARTLLFQGQGLSMTDRLIVTRQSPERNILNIFDLNTGKVIDVLKGFPSMVEKAILSSDGKYLAILESDGAVKVFELLSTKCLHTFMYPKNGVRRIMFIENDPNLAVVTSGGIAIHDLKSGKIDKAADFFPALAISHDGKMMAYKGEFFQPIEKTLKRFPNGLHILSSEKKKVIASFTVDPQWQHRQFQFTPDNRLLIAIGDRGIVRIWDVSKLEP